MQRLLKAIGVHQTVLDTHGTAIIDGICPPYRAGEHDVAYITPKHSALIDTTKAGALIVSPQLADKARARGAVIVVEDPYLAYASISQLFLPKGMVAHDGANIHPSAQIHADAKIGKNATIGAYAVIGRAVIGDNAVIDAHAWIDDGVSIGNHAIIKSHTAIHHGTSIGDDFFADSGSAIGTQGFGYARCAEHWVGIRQLGGVCIGNRVRIGAATMIDRGALDDTIIGDDVIIDNLVQIAHNVIIGKGSAIAGTAALAGSTVVGENCMIGGGAGLCGHLTLGDGTRLHAHTLVSKSLGSGEYASAPTAMPSALWRRAVIALRQLGKKHG